MKKELISVEYLGRNLEISIASRRLSDKWLVCLHGIQSNKELFESLENSVLLKGYSFLTMDLIGFGSSSKPTDFSYDLQDQANVVEKVIKKLDLKDIYLLGHSLGGMVAILLLNQLKTRVKAILNLEANLTYEDCGLSKLVAQYSFKDFEENQYSKIKLDVKSSGEPSGQLRSHWLSQIPDFVFYKTAKSIVKWSKSEILLKLFTGSNIKKVFIYGSENKEKQTRLPQGIKKIEISNAGHFMLIDNPKQSEEEIAKFLIPS